VPYIEGFVAAVPTANKDEYVKHARVKPSGEAQISRRTEARQPSEDSRPGSNEAYACSLSGLGETVFEP